MKAIVHAENLGMEGLSFSDIQDPQLRENEVRIKLSMAGLNHRDLFVIDRHKPTEPPLVIGTDGAGVIDAIGEGVVNI